MPAFFLNLNIMSWQIPTQIEQDIIAGKAKYLTFQTGSGGQSILPVAPNSYIVIFGYDFSPAGGGIFSEQIINASPDLLTSVLRWFETQQISFYTGTDFYPFIHHVNTTNNVLYRGVNDSSYIYNIIDNTPIARQLYITSNQDVTITHGLILTNPVATQNAIPVTNRTPQALTYGGSGQVINTQTNFGPALTPQQFMQPSTKDYQDFGFGLLPGNADGQAFATPDTTNGLRDASQFLTTLGATFRDAAAANYFLCLHYAVYSQTVPEQRG
jgi:hypothetical protein